jgi:integrase
MAKLNRLNALTVQRATKPGLLLDGGGLALQISKSGSKSWVFRYTLNKRTRMMGLGPITTVTLIEARDKAAEYRKQLQSGVDPLEAKNDRRQKKDLESLKLITFDECAHSYIESHKSGWKHQKHAVQWRASLKNYASPIIGHLPVQSIDTKLVMAVLQPIWHSKTETASRVRSRMELILAWAKVRGYRDGESPAQWRNHLDKLLPAPNKVSKPKHFAALDFNKINEFISSLRKHNGVTPLALEFIILTASRSTEARLATWQEINFEESLWILPPIRMKAGVEHRVPLSHRAIEILKELKATSQNQYVFPNQTSGKPLSDMAILQLARRTGYNVTVHGFRSAFRDWASEKTSHSSEVCEAALAHTNRNKTESAYRRGDLLLKRRALMNDWAKYCGAPTGNGASVIERLKLF